MVVNQANTYRVFAWVTAIDKTSNLPITGVGYPKDRTSHIEARNSEADINIGDGDWINNNAVIIANRTKISIGKNTLIGTEFTVYDSDFHDLKPVSRLSFKHETASVEIGENVFIGSRVTVLKVVSIGNNSVISAGSVVSRNIPPNVVAGGVPAKVIRDV